MITPEMLLVCYFLAFVAASLGVICCLLDAKRTKQRFYLISASANFVLMMIFVLLAGSAGDNPAFRGDWLRVAVRLELIAWACLSLVSRVLYLLTFIRVKRHEPIDGENENESTRDSV